MRAGIDQPVPVRRAAAQEPALHPSLNMHGSEHSVPGTHDLTLGLGAKQHHMGGASDGMTAGTTRTDQSAAMSATSS